MSTSFYTRDELITFGFKSLGRGVLISRKASIYKPELISIGDRVRIDDFCVIVGGSGMKLGNFIHIGCFSALYGGSGIVMEDFSGLSARVTIYSESDDYSGYSLTNPMIPDRFKPRYHKGQVILGRHVIIGATTTILPGVHLHEGVSVGAHSLVTKNCEEWTMCAGVPAKPLKMRNRNILKLEHDFLEMWNSQQNASPDV